MRKKFMKFTAVALTVAMTTASAMTVFASDLSGDGSYEGGEMKYPAIQITFPTVPEGIDYIADPNDLITSTFSGDAAKADYKGYDFSGDTGIYFKTKEKSGDPAVVRGVYSPESAPMVVTNENAQNLTITVALSKTSEASGDVEYSDTSDFSGDTAKKLYLAITDGTNTKALSAAENATLTTDIAGNTNNFEASYDVNDGYGYKVKSGDLTWNSDTFKVTGAINKNAEWKEDTIGVPNIKVTWSYTEKVDNAAPTVAESFSCVRGADDDLDIPYSLGGGSLGASEVSDVVVTFNNKLYSKNGAYRADTSMGNYITIGSNKITLSGEWLSYFPAGEYPICVVFDDDEDNYIMTTLIVE